MRASAALTVTLVAAACCAASGRTEPARSAATTPSSARPYADRHAARRVPAPVTSAATPTSRPAGTRAGDGDSQAQAAGVRFTTTAPRDALLLPRMSEKIEASDTVRRVEEDFGRMPTTTAAAAGAAVLLAIPASYHQSTEATESPVTVQRDGHPSSTTLPEAWSRHGEQEAKRYPPRGDGRTVEVMEGQPTASAPPRAAQRDTASHSPPRTTTASGRASPASAAAGLATQTTRGPVTPLQTRDAPNNFRSRIFPTPSASTETWTSKITPLGGFSFSTEVSSTKSLQTSRDGESTSGTTAAGGEGTTSLVTAPAPLPTRNKLVFELSQTPNDSVVQTEYTGKRRYVTSPYVAPNEAFKPDRKLITTGGEETASPATDQTPLPTRSKLVFELTQMPNDSTGQTEHTGRRLYSTSPSVAPNEAFKPVRKSITTGGEETASPATDKTPLPTRNKLVFELTQMPNDSTGQTEHTGRRLYSTSPSVAPNEALKPVRKSITTGGEETAPPATDQTPLSTRSKLVFEWTQAPNDSTGQTEYTGKRQHSTSPSVAPNEALKPTRKSTTTGGEETVSPVTDQTPLSTRNKLVFEWTQAPNDSTGQTEYTGKRRYSTSPFLAPNEALKPARKAIVITFPKFKNGSKQLYPSLPQPLSAAGNASSPIVDSTEREPSPLSGAQETTNFESYFTAPVSHSPVSVSDTSRRGEEKYPAVTDAADARYGGEEGKPKHLVLTVLVSTPGEGRPLVNETISFNLERRDSSADGAKIASSAHFSNDWTENSRAISSALAQLPSLQKVLKGFVLTSPNAKQEGAVTPSPPPTTSRLEPSPRRTDSILNDTFQWGYEKILTTPVSSSAVSVEDFSASRSSREWPETTTNVLFVPQKAEEVRNIPQLQTTRNESEIVQNFTAGLELNHENITKNSNTIVLYVDTGDCVPEVAEKISKLENKGNGDSGKQIVIEMNCQPPEQFSLHRSDSEKDGVEVESGNKMSRETDTSTSLVRRPNSNKEFSRQNTRADSFSDIKLPSTSAFSKQSTDSSSSSVRWQHALLKLKTDSPDSMPRLDVKTPQDSKRKGTRTQSRKTTSGLDALRKTTVIDTGKSKLQNTAPGSEFPRVAKFDQSRASSQVFLHPGNNVDQIESRMDDKGPNWMPPITRKTDLANERHVVKLTTEKVSADRRARKPRAARVAVNAGAPGSENEMGSDKFVKTALASTSTHPSDSRTLFVTSATQQPKTSPLYDPTAREFFATTSPDNLIFAVTDEARHIDDLSVDPSQDGPTSRATTAVPPWGFLKLYSLLESLDPGVFSADFSWVKSGRSVSSTPSTAAAKTSPFSSRPVTTTTMTATSTAATAAPTTTGASTTYADTAGNASSSQTDSTVASQQTTDTTDLQSSMKTVGPAVLRSVSEGDAAPAPAPPGVTRAAASAWSDTAVATSTSGHNLLLGAGFRLQATGSLRPAAAVGADGQPLQRRPKQNREGRSGIRVEDDCESLCRPRRRTVCAQVGAVTRTYGSLCDLKVEGCIVGEEPKILHTGACSLLRKKKTKVTIEQVEEIPEPESELLEDTSSHPRVSDQPLDT
ncbi:Follistatin-related protein 4 [Frankliniella fusca]|uniref:Follistatin-related protein 4 n=1 Tax=Frankliniella fusca TaxID=407009 RepID=A0AAE1HHS8_9NEOP|nr:Follistatin-related protein 4 [Frankliniella fusca]